MTSVQESAEDALRRLRADVEAFRSPSVRQLLEIDGTSPRGGATPRTRARLEAQLITLRTSLNATTSRSSDLEAKLDERTRALESQTARADRLQEELNATTNELNAERTTLSRRLQDVEREHVGAAASAAESSALLRASSDAAALERAQMQSELENARAALAVERASADAALAEASAVRADAEHLRAAADAEAKALHARVNYLEETVSTLRSEHDRSAEAGARHTTEATRFADSAAEEVAELRAECATRAVDARRLRGEVAALTAQLREARSEARRSAADAADVVRLRRRVKELEDCERAAKSADEVVDALKDEKDTLARLIGALAPSGEPHDGLAVLRNAALRREQRTLSRDVKKADAAPALDADVPEVSAAEIEALLKRMSEHVEALNSAKQEALAAAVERDAALEDAERNRRMRKIVEVERKLLRSAMTEAGVRKEQGSDPQSSGSSVAKTKQSSVTAKRVEAAEAAEAEYKRLVDELGQKVKERDAKLAEAVAKKTPVDDMTRDLCLLLSMQLRGAEQKQREAERDEAVNKVKELGKSGEEGKEESNKRKKRTHIESKKRTKRGKGGGK